MLFDLTWVSCGEVMRSDDDVVSTLVSPHMSQPTPVQYSTVQYSTVQYIKYSTRSTSSSNGTSLALVLDI